MRFAGDALVLATHNAGKLAEMRDLLAPFGVRVLSAAELGLAEPAETEASFVGNARIKAHAAAKAAALAAAMQRLYSFGKFWQQGAHFDFGPTLSPQTAGSETQAPRVGTTVLQYCV